MIYTLIISLKGTNVQVLGTNNVHVKYTPDSRHRDVGQVAPREGDRLFVTYGLQPLKGITDLKVSH